MRPYATVRVVGHNTHTTPQKTKTDKQGHTDPHWESSMVVELPQDASNEGSLYNLVVDIKHDSHVSDRVIGKVTIPLRDVLVNRERVGYLVMTKGEAHGKLVLSHSLVSTTTVVVAAAGEDDVVAVGATTADNAQGPFPLAPTTNPLVQVGLIAGATTIGDNMVNTASNLTDLFG
uniref:uncharacterized protein LOC122590087 n=1 Tax=Erigeron canadensis TaxID=72917 RepID=UPI001CB8C499|nr:uncharacterized protein LOC122590087 [Erigeron canadensis]